jgi:hypothetical protein
MQEKTTAVQAAEHLGEDEERVALEAAVLDEPEVPERILITPWGEVESSAGSFVVDEEAAKETIAAFERHGTDLPVDYEHQTLGGTYSSPSGQAPAAERSWLKAWVLFWVAVLAACLAVSWASMLAAAACSLALNAAAWATVSPMASALAVKIGSWTWHHSRNADRGDVGYVLIASPLLLNPARWSA